MTSLTGCSGEDFNAILKSLGYRLDRRPAPKQDAATPDVPTAAEPAEQLSEIADSNLAADIAEASVEATAPPEEAVEAEPEIAAAAEAAVAEVPEEAPVAADAADAPAEPAMIDIWRPGRFEHRRPERHRSENRPRHQGEARSGEAKTSEARSGEGRPKEGPRGRRPEGKDFRMDAKDFRKGPKGKGPRPQGERPDRGPPPPRRERPMDPNSPFAALAGLKAQLEGDKPKT
jgi:ATP-dependent RNA helicase SUPV3L1/SUV3